MDYQIRTGNKGLASTPIRTVGTAYLTVVPDATMEDYEWAICDGEEMIKGPYLIGPDTISEIRARLQELGAISDVGPTVKALPAKTDTTAPANSQSPKQSATTKPEAGRPVEQARSLPRVKEVEPVPTEALTATRDLNTLTAEIMILNAYAKENIVQIGLRLIEARAMIPHGGWLDYVREELEFTPRWAQFCMKAGHAFGSNAKSTSHLEAGTFYLLMDAPEEDRPALIERAPDMTNDQIAKAVEDAKQARREVEVEQRQREAAEKKALEFERQKDAADKRAADAVKKANQFEQDAKQAQTEAERLKTRPAPEPKTITTDNPEHLRRLAELEAESERKDRLRAEITAENARLLALVEGEQQARAKLEQTEKLAARSAEKARRAEQEWDETGLDPNGGRRLMEAIDPLYEPIAAAIAVVRQVKVGGAGGYCLTEPLYQLIKDSRVLADLIADVLDHRNRKTTLIIAPKEVADHDAD